MIIETDFCLEQCYSKDQSMSYHIINCLVTSYNGL